MNSYKENFTTFFHWFGWAISILASLFFLTFDVRDIWVSIFTDHNCLLIPFFTSLMISIVGSFASLFKPIYGGIMMFLGGWGMVLYFSLHGGLSNFSMIIAYCLPYIVAGVFFIFVRRPKELTGNSNTGEAE